MRRIERMLLTVSVAGLLASGCHPAGASAQPVTTTLTVNGMHCEGCVKTITAALSKLKGVDEVNVSLEQKQATVTYDANRVTVERLAEVIRSKGYEATAP